jgi:hypothetical protein
MIRISCTNCKTVLSIDDAFAGGVCRCQHCGTIQTVPSSAREASAVGSPGQAMGGSKSLFQAGSSSGSRDLEELSAAVVSSGLTSSRLKRSNKPLIEPKSTNLMPIIVAAGVVIALLVVVIIFLMTRNSSTAKTTADNGSTPGGQTSNGSAPTAADAANTPNFCTTPLTGTTVIYLIDCGQASKDCLGDLKDAVIKSARTLGSDRKFQILFWNKDAGGAYPESITTYATKESIDAAQKAEDAVFAYGQSDVTVSLQKAIAQHPDEIVLATGKGWDLDNAWLDSVLAIRGSSPVRIHCFNIDLGGDGPSAPLKRLAEKTGGTYHDLTKVQLHDFAQ